MRSFIKQCDTIWCDNLDVISVTCIRIQNKIIFSRCKDFNTALQRTYNNLNKIRR